MSSSTQPGSNQMKKRIFFNASASALAGQIVHPEPYCLDAVACSCLPAAGGYAEAHVHHHQGKGIFSFKSASTMAQGGFMAPNDAALLARRDYDDNDFPAQTSVEVTLEGFKIDAPRDPAESGSFARSLEIQHLHSKIGGFYDRRSPSQFKSLDATIHGVFIEGRELLVDINLQPFIENDTWQKLDGCLRNGPDRDKCLKQIFYHGEGATLGTVVTGLRWKNGAPEQTAIAENKLTITGLGSLYFGEILIQEGSRQLTLVRAQLGSVNVGSGAAADSKGGIQWVPPN